MQCASLSRSHRSLVRFDVKVANYISYIILNRTPNIILIRSITRWEFFEATSELFLFGCDSLDLKKNLFTISSKFINNCKLNVLFYNWDSFYGTLQIWCRPISLIIQGCSMVLYSIWPRNHTSHKKMYFNEFVANVLRGVIGIVIFDLRGHGGC